MKFINRSQRTMLGVTLLEIMLVLAVAALILVMSIKYYRTATASKQANDSLSMIQAIVSMADSVAMASGSYSTGGLTTTAVQAMLPNNGVVPWSTDQVTVAASAASYNVTLPAMPADVCPLVYSKLAGDPHYTPISPCTSSAANFTYTYNHTSGY